MPRQHREAHPPNTQLFQNMSSQSKSPINDACTGVLVGPVIGGLFEPVQVGWLATGGLVACSLWTLLFVQESLDSKTRMEVSLKLISGFRVLVDMVYGHVI